MMSLSPMPLRRFVARLVLAGCIVGCVDPVDPRPLAITITATPVAAAVGETITFIIDAQGGQLLQIDTQYGDGESSTLATNGATTAHVTLTHAYSATGTYQVIARALDGVEGQKDATVQVTIQ
jgi:hypothetical protein